MFIKVESDGNIFEVVNNGKLPTRATKHSAGVDAYANKDVTVGAGETAIIPLGICLDIEELVWKFLPSLGKSKKYFDKKEENFLKSHYIQLEPRSSLRVQGLLAGTGIIDIDFEQEICLILTNVSNEIKCISKGQRIAQLMLIQHKSYLFGIDSDTERTGGLGSTGK